jgi:hypothetical protein
MAQHPYVPTDIELPGFVPNLTAYEHIVAVFFGSSAVVVLLMFLVTGEGKEPNTWRWRLLGGPMVNVGWVDGLRPTGDC